MQIADRLRVSNIGSSEAAMLASDETFTDLDTVAAAVC